MFFKRCKEDGIWSLFSYDDTPELIELHGEKFVKKYEELEAAGMYRMQLKARDLHDSIVRKRCSKGMPYMVNKDQSNQKSNQSNLGK